MKPTEAESPGPDEDDPTVESFTIARTDTALDEFIPIYVALAMSTKRHGSLSPADVDVMDISVVAALLGVDSDTMAATHAAWVEEYDTVIAELDGQTWQTEASV